MTAKAFYINGESRDISPVVEITPDRIKVSISRENDFSGIERIKLDYFGAVADSDDNGYIVLPRGVGCNDYSMCLFNKHDEDFSREIYESNMPIFGVKSEKHNFLAVVSGLSYDYTLSVERINGRYFVYPIFEIHGEKLNEDICVEYFLFDKASCDYSAMARRYRKYRLDKGELVPLSEKMKKSKAVEYTVGSVMVRIRCGWKPAPAYVLHQTLENEPEMYVACDFDRIGELVDEFKRQGIEKAEFCLVGWNVKGHDGRWPQAFPVCEELGGEEKLKALIEKTKALGYQITCHTNSCDQYEIADIYDDENTRRDRFGKAVTNPEIWSGGLMYQLCPKIGYEQALEILPKVRELGFEGTHYLDVLGVVHPRRCYHEKHYVDSRAAVEYARKLCDFSRELFGGISSEGTFDFISPMLDYGLYVSFSNEPDGVCDKSIPFWEIVYHGYMMYNPYTMTVNPMFKNKESVLKLIEYGGRPSFYYYSKFTNNNFNWMGEDDAVFTSDEQMVSSVSKIKESIKLLNELESVYTATMDEHREISDNVFETTYSNGVKVTVDYNTQSYTITK
ncbi:MAG: hypothetical protein IJD67_02455 [Clostridia bacterium]|nr:hypothetical protein [Clostridia bacterium]